MDDLLDDLIQAPSAATISDAVSCDVCGASPAAPAVFGSCIGMVLAYRTHRFDGWVCRGCGDAAFVEHMNRTLSLGWWSPRSALLNVFHIARNLWNRSKVHRALPDMPDHQAGPRLRQRPGIYVAAIVALLLTGAVVRAAVQPDDGAVGSCVGIAGEFVVSVPCGPNADGTVIDEVEIGTGVRCSPAAELIVPADDDVHVLCVDLDR